MSIKIITTNEKGEENLCESGFFAEIDFRTDKLVYPCS